MNLKIFRTTLGQHPLAYMSAEFALSDRLPIYSGGLGVLAGDIVCQANVLNLPFVAVGLLYQEGYFKQIITLHGEQKEEYPKLNPAEAPIELVVGFDGRPILVTVPIKQEEVFIQIWEYLEGDVSVYLLDTNVPQNSPANRLITARLYGNDPELRLRQEMILGIGGVRALRELHIHPSIFHLNESHSALAIFEISHHYMNEYNMSFSEAYNYARQKIVFTNHTLIPAGNEVFSQAQIKEHMASYVENLQLPLQEMFNDGLAPDHPGIFSLSRLALTMACRINTVSKLHCTMAKQLWPDVAMPAITNGVFLPRWVSSDIKAQAPYFDTKAILNMEAALLWRLHEMAKLRLIDEVYYRTGKQLRADYLTITWARRFAAYKRPLLILSDLERLKKIVQNADRPVQIIMAGKAHPGDEVMHAMIQQVITAVKTAGLSDHIVFVPDYSLRLAEMLVAGSDVWLNTPLRGNEASGTSGMKAAANGVLQCSVSDGWMDEVDIGTIGWEIPDDGANALYDIITNQIVPLYYQRDAVTNVPLEWVERMKQAMILIWTQFSARRMLEQYIDVLYRPALELERKDKHQHNWRRNYRTRRIF